MLGDLWPQVQPHENPIDHVTNGVHVLTFLAPEWYDIFDRFLGVDWSQRLSDREYWNGVERIPDAMFWSVREYLKSQMLKLVRQRVTAQLLRNRGSESHLDRLFRFADPNNPKVLTIGFGRRFATYKRSTLLFSSLDELREICCNPERPVLFIFAGKAHPADEPGQDMIRADHARGEGARLHRPPAVRRGLRPAARAPAARRRGRVAQQPDLPARGVRHLRA